MTFENFKAIAAKCKNNPTYETWQAMENAFNKMHTYYDRNFNEYPPHQCHSILNSVVDVCKAAGLNWRRIK